MKKLWFFDLDGTLADTDRDIREAWKATLADLGLECPRFDELFVAGPPIEDMAKALFPEIYTDALCAAIRKGFGEHYDNDGFPNTVEYPGIVDRVRALKAAGATVVVATNKRYVGAVLIARKFGWERVFDGIYAGDMFKDDPVTARSSAIRRAISWRRRTTALNRLASRGATANPRSSPSRAASPNPPLKFEKARRFDKSCARPRLFLLPAYDVRRGTCNRGFPLG